MLQQDGFKTGTRSDDRLKYTFVKDGHTRAIREAVFLPDGSVRLEESDDGWELHSWEVPSAPGEIEFVKALRRRRARLDAPVSTPDLDSDLYFESLAAPEVCVHAMSALREMVQQTVNARTASTELFEPLRVLQNLHDDGKNLIEQYLDLKRAIREWIARVESEDSKRATFHSA